MVNSSKLFLEKVDAYRPMIEAMVDLFHPYLEIVGHDLATGKLVAIWNNFSRRQIGDHSPVPLLVGKKRKSSEELPDYFPPSAEPNTDGSPLKCSSITIRGENQEAIGLLCFNLSLRPFRQIEELLEPLLRFDEKTFNLVDQYGGNPLEIVKEKIKACALKKKLILSDLTKQEKRQMVHDLHRQGVFKYRNAHAIVAKKLKLSRASIYNYLARDQAKEEE